MSVSVGEGLKTWLPAKYVCAREFISWKMCMDFFDVAVYKYLPAVCTCVRAFDRVCT